MVYCSKWRIDDEGRECSRCGEYKTWDHFGKNKHGTRGRQSWCRSCFREYRGSAKRPEYVINDSGRECSRCGVFKAWDHFHRRHDSSTGHQSACKSCIKKKSQREKKQGRIRNAELQRKYGLSLGEYRKMLVAQNGQCAICGATETAVRGNGTELSLSVDHNHDTGEVRGLLCQRCNALLGFAGDDPDVLRRAIGYLSGELMWDTS